MPRWPSSKASSTCISPAFSVWSWQGKTLGCQKQSFLQACVRNSHSSSHVRNSHSSSHVSETVIPPVMSETVIPPAMCQKQSFLQPCVRNSLSTWVMCQKQPFHLSRVTKSFLQSCVRNSLSKSHSTVRELTDMNLAYALRTPNIYSFHSPTLILQKGTTDTLRSHNNVVTEATIWQEMKPQ